MIGIKSRIAHGVSAYARRWPASFVFMLALAVGAAFQGSRGLYETTEGRYALAAREMLDQGVWGVPTLEERPHVTKPPLTYWCIVLGMKVVGRNTWGARLWIAPVFAVTALAVASLAGAFTRRREDFLCAGILYATAIFPAAIAASLNTDTLLTLWTTLGVLCYVKARQTVCRQPRRSAFFMGLMWLAFGLGMLTKGPPALLILLPILVFHGVTPARRRPWLAPPVGIAAFVVVGLGWYLWMIMRNPDMLRYFLVTETFNRMATGTGHHNSEWYKPLTVYGLPLVFGAGFWPVLIPRSAWHRLLAVDGWRRLLKRRRGPAFFLCLWFLFPLLVLSLSKSRLETYVLPIFPVLILWLTVAMRSPGSNGPMVLPPGGGRVAVASILLILSAKILLAQLPYMNSEHLGGGTVLQRFRRIQSNIGERDIGRLFAACRPWLSTEPRLLMVDRRRNLGIRFYLDQPCLRLLRSPSERYPDAMVLEDYFLATPRDLLRGDLLIVASHEVNATHQAAAVADRRLLTMATIPAWTLYRIADD